VWRSLLRLGVNQADCDDGCQRVWIVVARKAESMEPEKEKSFIFSVVLRVASDMRRSQKRNEPVEFDEYALPPGTSSGVIDAETLLERQRGWRLLDQLLGDMSWELRTVFVMYEIEGMSSVEIASALGLPRGTVASRLRLAREAFRQGVQRYQVQPQAKANASGRRRRPWWFG
jgi:RNA polymerase sigma-70 factor (ECF subfamily)